MVSNMHALHEGRGLILFQVLKEENVFKDILNTFMYGYMVLDI